MAGPVRAYANSLAAILLDAGVVTAEQVDAGLTRQRTTGLRIGETLVEMGVATEEDIGWALARQLGLPFVDPQPEALDRELIGSFPEGLLRRLDAVPLVNVDSKLSMALADPTDSDLVGELERAAGRPLQLAVATPSTIRRVLREILGSQREPRATLPVTAQDVRFDVQWDRSGASFLLFHLSEARGAGADEIHFVAGQGTLEVLHRVGGRLVPAASEPAAAVYYLLARIEALGGPALDDSLIHVAGRVACPAGPETIDLGVSLLHQDDGVSVTLEIRSAPLLALEDLGIDPVDLARIRAALEIGAGLGIVTGPPRAGGSTTLACLLGEAGLAGCRALAFGAARAPAGVRVPGTAEEAARAWADAAVAQCADVIVLDGVLTGYAATEALSAKAAGRLLLVRTDWTDSFALLEQLAGRPQDRAALAERLRFVIQQRLVRLDGSAVPLEGGAVRPDGGAVRLDGSAVRPDASGPPRDRRAVFEVLIVEEPMRAVLRAGEPAARLRTCAEADGLRPLAAQLKALVASGYVSAAEAARHVA